ncbi:MAG: aminoacyl-tRNA deacylase [Chloroflexota bacterium]|nr:aminoacyl-tRNA deacylase [Chloroflexota bacterium]
MSKARAAVSKTNAMRALDQAGVGYEAYTYDPALMGAVEVAEALGVPAGQVYKTLVMLRDEMAPLLVMVSGEREVDLRVLAQHIGSKSVRMAPKAEAERLTGLQTGGIGALALLAMPFPVYLDRAALGEQEIFVNGGRRGLNLRVPVADLVRLTVAAVVDVR